MNHDFEDELSRNRTGRSRRRPGAGERSYTERPETKRPAEEPDSYGSDYDMDFDLEDKYDANFEPFEEEVTSVSREGKERSSARSTSGERARFQPERTEEKRASSRASGASRTRAASGSSKAGRGETSSSGARGSGRDTATNRSVREAKQMAVRAKRRKIIGWILAECIALVCIFSYAYAARTWNLIQRPDFQEKNVTNTDLDIDTVEKMKGYWTLAVFGVDSRTNNISRGTNADVNMICNINQDTGEIKLVSVFRDSYLNIDDKNSYNKINQAYANGGPEQAVKALNKNMDLNITDYVTFNWKAVADAINILGGIDLEISKAEFAYINSFITETVEVTGVPSRHLKKAGMNHLDGVQAVAYGRLRLMDTDFARTERQRKIIQLAFDKAKKADIAVLNNLMVTIFPQVATSVDMADLSNVVFNVSKYHIGETTGFPSARGDANMGKKGACVIPQTLESNVMDIHKFLFGEQTYVPSNTVKTISKKISSDSGMYNEGTKIDKVPTDGGYIPKPTKAPVETKEEETKKTDETADETLEGGSESSSGDLEHSTAVPETDESGNPKETTSGSGQPTSSTGPTNSTKPSATNPSQTSPVKPAETSPAGTTGATRPSQTNPAKPTTPTTEAPGPGTMPTTAAPSSSEAPTVPPLPVESSSSSGGAAGPGGSSDSSGVVVGAPGQ